MSPKRHLDNAYVIWRAFPCKFNRCTCEDGTYTCGNYGYDCEDPTAPTDCPTPTPAAGLGYPDCTGYMYDLQNGYCDNDLNNEDCGELYNGYLWSYIVRTWSFALLIAKQSVRGLVEDYNILSVLTRRPSMPFPISYSPRQVTTVVTVAGERQTRVETVCGSLYAWSWNESVIM